MPHGVSTCRAAAQVVVWDTIINDKPSAWIRSESVVNKYSLTDQGYGLRANNVTLVVNWNIVPSTGLLTLNHEHEKVFRFVVPEEYTEGRDGEATTDTAAAPGGRFD